MVVSSPIEITATLFLEQRERLSNGQWTEWHPLNLNNAQEGLFVGQRFQRRANGSPTGIMIFDDTPGAKFQTDPEAVAP